MRCHVSLGKLKKMDGNDYPPNMLKEIIVMIQMFLREKGIYWKLLDPQSQGFLCLRNIVDNLMKQRTASGLGVRISSNTISLAQEDKLFFDGILGDDEPEKLLKTVIYMLGLHLALQGGVEHARLRRPGFDLQVIVDVDDKGRERLLYREDPLHKTNQEGIGARRLRKTVYVYGANNSERCPVRLFKKYARLLPPPKSCKKMYLRPRIKPTPSCWYTDQSYGCNKVSVTVKEICKQAGFEGKFTNHSLKATSASRMYNNNVPEQMIKEITGHQSDCVRIYKRTSDDVRKVASETISGVDVTKNESKEGLKQEGCDAECTENCESVDKYISETDKKRLAESLSACQMIKNVIKSRIEMRKKMSNKSKVVRKVANKLLKKRIKTSKKVSNLKNAKNRIVIDLNVNVNFKK